MDISDIDAELVGNCLEHLETERGNSAKSRNIRLAAIRSFFRHVSRSTNPRSCTIARRSCNCRQSGTKGAP